MKSKLTIFVLILLSLFLFSSCELLNPLFESKSKTPIDNFQISIERTHGTIQGQAKSVEILLHNNTLENYQLGSVDLRIAYDPNVLIFQSVEEGSFLTNCAWEYFTVQHEIIHIDSLTTINTIRIVAHSNLNFHIANCFTPNDSTSNQLFVLNFLVTNNRNYECTYSPLQFFWKDCSDNQMNDLNYDYSFMSNDIYDKLDTTTDNLSLNLAKNSQFPSYFGYNSNCDSVLETRGDEVIRNINFINGGIDIAGVCMYPAARGDINLNEIQYEIADAVLYSNYFVYGESVFTKDIEKQIAQTDVDADGVTLTVADLTYLKRVMIGDANPYPSEATMVPLFVNGKYFKQMNGNIHILNNLKISAAHIVIEGEIIPTLLADSMTMAYNYDGTNTNILVSSLELYHFTDSIINIGNGKIISIEMANLNGIQVVLNSNPSSFSMGQNYPNPFSTLTYINISLPILTEVTFEVRNNSNEIVFESTDAFNSGIHQIVFDGTMLDSGSYPYTIRTSLYENTKTMDIIH